MFNRREITKYIKTVGVEQAAETFGITKHKMLFALRSEKYTMDMVEKFLNIKSMEVVPKETPSMDANPKGDGGTEGVTNDRLSRIEEYLTTLNTPAEIGNRVSIIEDYLRSLNQEARAPQEAPESNFSSFVNPGATVPDKKSFSTGAPKVMGQVNQPSPSPTQQPVEARQGSKPGWLEPRSIRK